MLGVPFACAAISRTDLTGAGKAQPHLALLRAPGSVWIVEFIEDEQVRIRDGTNVDAELALSLRLAPQPAPHGARKRGAATSRVKPLAKPVTRPVPTAEALLPAPKKCRKCGAALKLTAKFCKDCGTPVA